MPHTACHVYMLLPAPRLKKCRFPVCGTPRGSTQKTHMPVLWQNAVQNLNPMPFKAAKHNLFLCLSTAALPCPASRSGPVHYNGVRRAYGRNEPGRLTQLLKKRLKGGPSGPRQCSSASVPWAAHARPARSRKAPEAPTGPAVKGRAENGGQYGANLHQARGRS